MLNLVTRLFLTHINDMFTIINMLSIIYVNAEGQLIQMTSANENSLGGSQNDD